jgi:hypothetical protein
MYLEDTSNVYAEEGTCAHAICESLLTKGKIPDNLKMNNYYSREMTTHCIDYVRMIKRECRGESWTMFVETRLDIPITSRGECFGTVDFMAYRTKRHKSRNEEVKIYLNVFDFKYGKTKVKAEENLQLILYAYGACEKLGLFELTHHHNIHIKLGIFQPRVSKLLEFWEITGNKLLERIYKLSWIAADALSWDRNKYLYGGHCFWCKAKKQCKEYKRSMDVNLSKEFDA